MHKRSSGRIPIKQWVTVRWVVLPTRQTIYVNGELRHQHDGDYSGIDNHVSVFPAEGSTVTVKSITVKSCSESQPKPVDILPHPGLLPKEKENRFTVILKYGDGISPVDDQKPAMSNRYPLSPG